MEVPRGFEPRVEDLQSFALPAWLWNQLVQYITFVQLRQEKSSLLFALVLTMIEFIVSYQEICLTFLFYELIGECLWILL